MAILKTFAIAFVLIHSLFAFSGPCEDVVKNSLNENSLNLAQYVTEIYVPVHPDFGSFYTTKKFIDFPELVELVSRVRDPGTSDSDIELAKSVIEEKIVEYYGDQEFVLGRRNYEYLFRALNQRYLDQFVDNLTHLSKNKNNEIKSDDLISIANQYFSKSVFKSFKGRGGYGFERVLDVATLIQRKFKNVLQDQNSSMIIYGSFPNGKSNLKKSDIDLHLIGPIEDLYVLQYDIQEYWNILPRGMHPRGNKLLTALSPPKSEFKTLFNQTEDEIAKYLGRSFFTYGSFLTVMPEEKGDVRFYVDDKPFYHSPLKIIIEGNNLSLEIVDALSASPLKYKFRIIP